MHLGVKAMRGNLYWKDKVDDLRSRAEIVICSSSDAAATMSMSARTAARCMAGICGLVARRFTVDTMQRTCADLARHERAWETSLGDLPHENGVVSDATQLVACVARGLLSLAGVNGVRAALSFWATEDDHAVWNDVVSG